MSPRRKNLYLLENLTRIQQEDYQKVGRRRYNAATGSKLQRPVTKKSGLSKREKGRRKSFCARMKGVKGAMKDSKGRPTRKALALRKWRC